MQARWFRMWVERPEKPGTLTGHAQMRHKSLPKSCFDYNSEVPCGRLRLSHTISLLPDPRLYWEEEDRGK